MMWTWVLSLLSQFGTKIVLWSSIVLAVLLAIIYIRKGGRDAEKLDNLMSGIEAIQMRSKIERSARGTSDADLNKWLHNPKKR